jgi:hypothetical protein
MIVFYDAVLALTELEREIKRFLADNEEKEELWNVIDDIIHHRVVSRILEAIPDQYHMEFLLRFYEAPYDQGHFEYLNGLLAARTEEKIEEIIKKEMEALKKELIKEIRDFMRSQQRQDLPSKRNRR